MSLYMHIYLFLNKLHFDPTVSMALMLAIDIILLAYAYWFLTKTLLPKSPVIISIIVIVFAFFTFINSLNLANYGGRVFNGLYYNAADAFRLMSIALWIRKSYIKSVALITLSILTHAMMGICGLIFIFGMQLLNIKRFFEIRVMLAFILASMVIFCWLIWQMPAATLGQNIPKEDWFFFTQLTNYHWYPLALKRFTSNFNLFFNFLCLLTIAVYATFYLKNNLYYKEILAGFGVIILATVFGVFISAYAPNPIFIKLAIHRASEFISRIGIIYIAAYIWQEINEGNCWRKSIALVTLCTPLFYLQTPFLLITVLLVTYPAFIEIVKKMYKPGNIITLILVSILTILACVYYYFGYTDKTLVIYLGQEGLRNNFLLALAVFGGLSLVSHYTKATYLFGLFAILIFYVCLCLDVQKIKPYDLPENKIEFYKSYYDVQLWAKNKTNTQSLFMIDPSISPYGWKAFSHRSSFGTPKQWLFTWLYTSDYSAYYEGLKRFREYGLNLDAFLLENPLNVHTFLKIQNVLEQRFYQLIKSDWIDGIAEKYNISYIVLKKEDANLNEMLYSRVYENHHFIVFKVKSGKHVKHA